MRNERVLTVSGEKFQSVGLSLTRSVDSCKHRRISSRSGIRTAENRMNTSGPKGLSSVAQLTKKLCRDNPIVILLQSDSLRSKYVV